MKNTILALLMLFTMPSTGNAEVKNSLTIKNNTNETVWIAYAWYNKVENCWKTKGWKEVPAYSEFRRDLNGLELGDNTMYVYAKGKDKKEWTGNSEFRVDNDKDFFDISLADKFTSKMQTAKFKSVRVGQGDTRFTINP